MLIPSTVDSSRAVRRPQTRSESHDSRRVSLQQISYRIDQLRTGHCHDDCLFPRHGGRVQSPD